MKNSILSRVVKITKCPLSLVLVMVVQDSAHANPWRWQANTVLIAADTDDKEVDAEVSASFDLFVERGDKHGAWVMYLEANTYQHDHRISALIPESNADAGTAVDGNGDGRVQISELYYSLALSEGQRFYIGLLDATGILGTSNIANDENKQFLAPSLVNNPTVEYPDYSVGLMAQASSATGLASVSLALLRARGLADNPNRSYREFFDQLDEEIGMFIGVEAQWQQGVCQACDGDFKIGVWSNTSEHQALDDQSRVKLTNYGIYVSAEQSVREHGLLLRTGAARETVSVPADFLSLAYQYQRANYTAGLGWTRTFLSEKMNHPAYVDTDLAEIYWRLSINKLLSLSPYLQKVDNSGFSKSRDFIVAGVRFNAQIL